ncbi:MAG: glutamine--fructose-6-phosphate transaminase (isomerizing) [Acutalibacteraceae bacterium]
MCGIVGYIGKNKAVPYLLSGLEKLEYRGYDSAGVATLENGEILVTKAAGRLNNLERKLQNQSKNTAHIGIGHTRWATHGEPSDTNAHPHPGQKGLFCVVHNGIIENFQFLKNKLEKDGVNFASQTDTEVISQLLEKNYDGDVLKTIAKTAKELEGSFALAILCKDIPDKIFCTRRANPLVLGKSEEGSFIASDVTAMLKYTHDVYKLSDDEIAVVEDGAITFTDGLGNAIEKPTEHISWSIEDAEKSGYEHFMLKEIMQQPKAVYDTVHPRIQNNNIVLDNVKLSTEELQNIRKIYIVACGSAYHVGVIGKYVLEKMTRIPTEADIASEFRYRNPIIGSDTLVLIISQSGETADTLAALRLAKKHGAKTLSIVNVVGSSIANESDDVLLTYAGPEIAVATTKAYSAQLCVIYLIAAKFAQLLGRLSNSEFEAFLSDLEALPKKIQQILDSLIGETKELANDFINLEHAYFIGRNIDYAGAMESSLKMKEISYIHSEAYGAGELKHGTISLIEKGTVVVALCCCDAVFAKTLSNIKEVRARGAKVIALTTEKHKDELIDVDSKIVIPDCCAELLPSLEVIPMQLLSYYTAVKRGCDVDKPRNLAKSVTVE